MHREGVDHIGDFIQQRRIRDDEHRDFHKELLRAARAAIERNTGTGRELRILSMNIFCFVI